MKRPILLSLFILAFLTGFVYVVAFSPAPVDKSASDAALRQDANDLAKVGGAQQPSQTARPLLNATPTITLTMTPGAITPGAITPGVPVTPLDLPMQELPAPTFDPTRVYGVLDELVLLPGELPGFDPVILFTPVDTALTLDETITYLKRIYPDEASFIDTLATYYTSAGVFGTYESRFVAQDCFEHGQLYGFGTWLRNLPGEASAKQLYNDPLSAELYASIFGWQAVDDHPLDGNLYTVFAPPTLCQQTSLIYVLDYQYGPMIVSIMIYAHFETPASVVYENMAYLAEHINGRIEARTGILPAGATSVFFDDEATVTPDTTPDITPEITPEMTSTEGTTNTNGAAPEGHSVSLQEVKSPSNDRGGGVAVEQAATDTPPAAITPLPTETPQPTATNTDTPVPTATHTPAPTSTLIPTDTPTPLPMDTVTPLPTSTPSPTPTSTFTAAPTSTPTPFPTPTPTPALSSFPADQVCDAWLTYTIDSLATVCNGTQPGEVCAGSRGVTAFNQAGLPIPTFGQPGSVVFYERFIREIAGSRDDAEFTLGTALLRPQEGVTVLLYGDARLGVMQANPLDFFIDTATDSTLCPQTSPFILINAQAAPVQLTVNAAPLTLQGAALLRILTPGNTLQIINLHGQLELDGRDPLAVPEGFASVRCISSPGDPNLRTHTVYDRCPWLDPQSADTDEIIIMNTASQLLERTDFDNVP